MSSIQRRIRRAEQRAAGRAQAARGVPSAAELWRYQLVSAVEAARSGRNGKLCAHQYILQSYDDVRAASDDVLLVASGFPDVERWGWLYVMVRDLTWFCMLARNWNLPHMLFLDCDPGETTEEERRAYAARQFCVLMQERGHDPLGMVRDLSKRLMARLEATEEKVLEILRGHSEWMGFVYTCESVLIRPKVLREHNGQNRVLYMDGYRADFLAKIRAAQV